MILNTEYKHLTKYFKEKYTEMEVNYNKLSVGDDLKKLTKLVRIKKPKHVWIA